MSGARRDNLHLNHSAMRLPNLYHDSGRQEEEEGKIQEVRGLEHSLAGG